MGKTTTREKETGEAVGVIYARVGKELRGWFKTFCKDSNRAEAEVIERLLGYLHNLEKVEQMDILGGQVVPAFSHLIERLEWANHAFDRRFWTWALEEYQEVERLAQKCNASGIAWLARYKESYCWLDIAMFWRDEAIKDGAKAFERARTAAMNSLVLSQKYLDHHLHRVMFFNIACAWSLLARFTVEEKLLSMGSSLGKKLVEGETSWDEIGKKWRAEISDDEVKKKVASYGDKAMDNFVRMVKDAVIPFDFGFLLGRWQSDGDLIFLRTDEHFCADFRKFAEQNLTFLNVGKAFDRLSQAISDGERRSTLVWSPV